MEEQLKQFIADIKNKGLIERDEATTKQIIILRLFSILGWNVYDPDEVRPEHSVGGKKVDYSLRHREQNKVFVEVKKSGEDLEIHQEQLLNYAFHEGIEIAILTNGLSWWFYLPLNPGSWEQRKFFSIDITQQQENEIIGNFINFLAKENVIPEKSLETAKKLYKSNQKDQTIIASLPKAWNKLIQETDEQLIELINDTNEKICGYRAPNEQIAEFLSDNNDQLLLGRIKKYPEKTKIEKLVSTDKNDSEYVPTGYTGKIPASFFINNKKIAVKHWIDILAETCNYLYVNHQGEFEQKANSIRGRKRVYFSRNKDVLRVPMQIKNSGLYVESNLSATSIVKLSENLAALFGYDSELRIEVE